MTRCGSRRRPAATLLRGDTFSVPPCLFLGRSPRLTRCEFTVQDSDRLTLDENAAAFNSPSAANVHRAVKESRKNANLKGDDALARAHDDLKDTCRTSK